MSGASILALEIMNSRTLAPYYGNSLFVWGSLIGVVLTGLSLGYYYGGKKADLNPSYVAFSTLIFVAGVYVFLTTIGSTTIFLVVLASRLGERFGPLLASILLLGLPSILLGMVSPYAIRISAKEIGSVGKTAGNLYAISTMGSIAGTFITVFILIPEAPLTTNLYGISIILITVSLVGLSSRRKGLAAIALAGSIALIMSPPAPVPGVLEQRDTMYHRVVVWDDTVTGVRTLLLDNNFHSAMDLRDPERVVYLYTGFFNIGFAYNPDVKEVLFIGGGGFSGPKQFLRDYEDVSIDVVEIDPDVVDIAKKYFMVENNERMNIYVEDGRTYLTGTDKKYDLIVLDAYAKTYVSFHLMTKEFHQLTISHLNDNGVLVSNVITALEGDASDLFRSEILTMKEVYPSMEVYKVSETAPPSFVQNLIVVATKSPKLMTTEKLFANSKDLVKAVDVNYMINSKYYDTIDTSGASVLLDNYAPVENLLNPMTGTQYVKEVITNEEELVQELQTVPPPTETIELNLFSNSILIVGIIVGSIILIRSRAKNL